LTGGSGEVAETNRDDGGGLHADHRSTREDDLKPRWVPAGRVL